MSDDRKNLLVRDGMTVSESGLLTAPIGQMETEEVHYGWSILDVIEKTAKKRKDAMKKRLMDDAELHGTEDPEKGHLVLDLPMGRVTRQKRVSKPGVNETAVRQLIIKKGIEPALVFSIRSVESLDVGALEDLIRNGTITEDEAETLFIEGKVTWALRVDAPPHLKKQLTSGSK